MILTNFRDLVVVPSSPVRHTTELNNMLRQEDALSKLVVLLYIDGGPDHRLTNLSVQLAPICSFLKGDYDMVIAARTPPMCSGKNPLIRLCPF